MAEKNSFNRRMFFRGKDKSRKDFQIKQKNIGDQNRQTMPEEHIGFFSKLFGRAKGFFTDEEVFVKKRRKRKCSSSKQMIRNFIAKQTRRNEYRRRKGNRKMAQRSI